MVWYAIVKIPPLWATVRGGRPRGTWWVDGPGHYDGPCAASTALCQGDSSAPGSVLSSMEAATSQRAPPFRPELSLVTRQNGMHGKVTAGKPRALVVPSLERGQSAGLQHPSWGHQEARMHPPMHLAPETQLTMATTWQVGRGPGPEFQGRGSGNRDLGQARDLLPAE